MRRPCATLALSLSLTLLATLARAQIAAEGETWRLTRDRVEYSIAEWGTGCGPRPEDRSNATGREVTIRTATNDLEISTGGRRQRTDQCWSDNRHTEPLAHARVGNTWTVSCATPAGEGLGERGTYTTTLEGDRLSLRGETRYAWTLQGSSCRATATATRTYERVSGAPPVPAPAPAPAPTPPAPPPAPTPPPAPAPPRPAPAVSARCTPGAPVSITVSPARRSTTSGGRVCFRARAVDAARCESAAQDVRWTTQRARGVGEGSMDRGCFVSAAGGGVGLFEVTAAAGALTARAEVEVVTQDRYATLIAERIEDPDGGAPEENSGGQVAGGTLAPEVRRDRTPWLFALGGGAAALALILLLTQRKRAPKPAVYDDDDAPRPRREVMPPQELSSPSMPTQPPPLGPNRRREEPVAAEPVAPAPKPSPKHCPYCRKVYTGELTFCPEDGQALAPGTSPPAGAVATHAPQSAGERRCPKCGRSFPSYMDFCGEDGTALPSR